MVEFCVTIIARYQWNSTKQNASMFSTPLTSHSRGVWLPAEIPYLTQHTGAWFVFGRSLPQISAGEPAILIEGFRGLYVCSQLKVANMRLVASPPSLLSASNYQRPDERFFFLWNSILRTVTKICQHIEILLGFDNNKIHFTWRHICVYGHGFPRLAWLPRMLRLSWLTLVDMAVWEIPLHQHTSDVSGAIRKVKGQILASGPELLRHAYICYPFLFTKLWWSQRFLKLRT